MQRAGSPFRAEGRKLCAGRLAPRQGTVREHRIRLVVAHSGRDDRDRAGSLLPSAQQTGFALGAALAGIIANALGFEHMTRIEEYRTAAFWLFAAFVPPALLGNVIAWRFGNRIGAGSAS